MNPLRIITVYSLSLRPFLTLSSPAGIHFTQPHLCPHSLPSHSLLVCTAKPFSQSSPLLIINMDIVEASSPEPHHLH